MPTRPSRRNRFEREKESEAAGAKQKPAPVITKEARKVLWHHLMAYVYGKWAEVPGGRIFNLNSLLGLCFTFSELYTIYNDMIIEYDVVAFWGFLTYMHADHYFDDYFAGQLPVNTKKVIKRKRNSNGEKVNGKIEGKEEEKIDGNGEGITEGKGEENADGKVLEHIKEKKEEKREEINYEKCEKINEFMEEIKDKEKENFMETLTFNNDNAKQ